METFCIKALQLILALALLVTIHEFGHYLMARIFGIKVNRFYLFFNPWFSLAKYYPSEGKLELIAWTTEKKEEKPEGVSDTHGKPEDLDKDNNAEEPEVERHALLTLNVGKPRAAEKNGKPTWAATMYGLGWLPLGGYCDIAGMVDETKGADQLSAKPDAWEFRSKPAWQRFMVMVGGVLFNFLLAIVIYAGIAYHWGERAIAYQDALEGMNYCEVMHDAGFEDGDVLLTVNGQLLDITNRKAMWDMMQGGARVKVLRNHQDTVSLRMPDDMLERMANEKHPMSFRVPVMVNRLSPGMPAEKAGLREGDRIVKVAQDTTPTVDEFFAALAKHKDEKIPLGVIRDGDYIRLSVHTNSDAKIGFELSPLNKIYPVTEIKYSLLESVPQGWKIGTQTLGTYVASLKLLFTKTGAQSVGGFGTLGSLFPEKWNWYTFWEITAFLSIILAVMNIIPIPGLDGGHVLFLLTEIVSGRKPSDKFLEIANTIGFFFLLLLLLYANGADVVRLFK